MNNDKDPANIKNCPCATCGAIHEVEIQDRDAKIAPLELNFLYIFSSQQTHEFAENELAMQIFDDWNDDWKRYQRQVHNINEPVDWNPPDIDVINNSVRLEDNNVIFDINKFNTYVTPF